MSALTDTLTIENLQARIAGKDILNGVSLRIRPGEVHALMGPNGSGKSTLSNVIMGHPDYEVTGGSVRVGEQDLLAMEPEDRARAGLFLAFQYPVALPGVTVAKFLKTASDACLGERRPAAADFIRALKENARFLEMEETFINRNLNEGFSGGEKKRMEVLQMLMLKPRFAILDETDSGLDIDALKVVSKGVNRLVGQDFGLLVITHYERILTYIEPDHLHIMMQGRIVKSGGPDLVKELEDKGYDWVRDEMAVAARAGAGADAP